MSRAGDLVRRVPPDDRHQGGPFSWKRRSGGGRPW
ncbi:hypothetical protein SHL15_4715 [Streptomyces hygroscopicus subsp. limoneus]|nr:hypothetical protein SHL15_4715 [Streptomyces hygroscopicus subsp. limoneus]